MKYKRKILAVMLTMAIVPLMHFVSAKASLALIHETKDVQTITSGATLEKITRFTNDGWLNISLLKVNLSNSNIKVDTLQNINSLRNLNSTINLAKTNGAVAAINASFFVYGKQSEPGTGTPIGPIIKSGVLQSIDCATNKEIKTFGTFSISNFNKAFFNYWKTSMTLTAPNALFVPVARYNKPYYGHTDYTIIDSKYRTVTYGTTYSSSDICEMIVVEGVVSEIRNRMPSTSIPKNGYAVITRTEGSKFLLDNFKVGDAVKFDVITSPNSSNINMSVSGGAMLIQNGKIPATFSHSANSSSREARTAIGSSKDGKQLFMVTVDEVPGQSVGMTQKELASYMLGKGAYNALNLDGGSSSTMVARAQQSGVLQLINLPEEYTQRSVPNAIGLFSTAPASELGKLVIYASDKNVFVNTSRTYTVKGYDKNLNPIAIKSSDIVWSKSGITGSFKGSTFYPTSVGSGYIYAAIGGIKTKFKIYSLSSPVQLILSCTSIAVYISKTLQLNVIGKNVNGYYAPISASDVKWSSSSEEIGTVSKGLVKANKVGSFIVDASIGKTHTYAMAIVPLVSGLLSYDTESLELPADTPIADNDKRYVAYKKSSTSLIFSVFGNVTGITDTTKISLTKKLIKTINSTYSFGAFLTKGSNDFSKMINKPNISTNCGYKSIDLKDSRFIQLDIKSGGLRLTASAQWKWLISKLNSNTKTNVFIFISKDPLEFNDSKESALLQDILTNYKQKTNKRIWVFHRGETNSSYMERGIKYISTAGFAAAGYSSKNKSAAKYAIVKVMGNSVTYGFKSI